MFVSEEEPIAIPESPEGTVPPQGDPEAHHRRTLLPGRRQPGETAGLSLINQRKQKGQKATWQSMRPQTTV